MAGSIKNLRPESARRMMSEMSNRQTFIWVGVAAIFHLILIIVTSWGFIRAHFIDRSTAEAPTVQAPVDAQAQTPVPPAPAPDATAANATARPAPSDVKSPTDAKPTATPDAGGAKPPTPPSKNSDSKSPSHDGFKLDDSSLK